GRGKEKIVGEGGQDRREQRGTETGEHGDGQHRRRVQEVDGGIDPSRGERHSDQGRNRDEDEGFGKAADAAVRLTGDAGCKGPCHARGSALAARPRREPTAVSTAFPYGVAMKSA